MELKPQELLILLKAVAHPERRFTYATLAEELSMSSAEVHASVKRAVSAGLAVSRGRGNWSPVRPALLEFLQHGVRYAFPATLGPVKRGVATSYGVEPLASLLSAGQEEAPVWAYPEGQHKGPSLSPIYRTAPQAALSDPALHRLLALLDALRMGRARERDIAARCMTEELGAVNAAI